MKLLTGLFLLLSLPLKLWQGVPPEMTVLATEDRGGYICSLVEYTATEGERVSSFLLVPQGASASEPRPGLVLLHDHGARFDIGKEKLVRPMATAPEYIKASSRQWVESGFDGVYFGDRLAAEGYVVIVPDVLYWGGRSSALCQEWSRMEFSSVNEGGAISPEAIKKAVYEGQRAVYDSLARNGVVWAEKTLNEDAAAARLLATLPYVSEVGCFGWSMGAHRAWLLTAFCPEVKTGVALCWMTLKEAQPSELSASDYSMLIPALRDRYDFPDIVRWIAPKSFFFLSGRTDKLFPEWAVQKAFDRMQEIYSCHSERSEESPLRTEFFEGGHHCGLAEQERIIGYLRQTLAAQKCTPGAGGCE